jgi:hypothetical protein
MKLRIYLAYIKKHIENLQEFDVKSLKESGGAFRNELRSSRLTNNYKSSQGKRFKTDIKA